MPATKELRSLYRAFKAQVLANEHAGWSAADLPELEAILAADLADGPGAERPFPMTLAERQEGWRGWLQTMAGPAAGITERIRARNEAEREEKTT